MVTPGNKNQMSLTECTDPGNSDAVKKRNREESSDKVPHVHNTRSKTTTKNENKKRKATEKGYNKTNAKRTDILFV